LRGSGTIDESKSNSRCLSVRPSTYLSTCLTDKSAEKRQDLQYRCLFLLVEALLSLLGPDGCLGGLTDKSFRRYA
jgi:hypothetical protein